MNITRREMIAGGIASLLPIASFGSLTRSIIASKQNFAYSGDDVIFPYVSNGLIAMWDGIWNAGLGVHNSNASTWLDLANGLQLPLGNNMQWSYDALQMRPTSNRDYSGGFNDIPANQIFSEIINSAWTIQVGYSFPISQAANMIFQLYGYGYIMQDISILLRFTTYVNTRVPSNGGCYTIVFDGINRLSLFYNDTLMWNGSGTANTTSNGTIRMNGVANGAVNIDYNFVRIYSRALTQEEISYNYAIDMERFYG